MKIIVTGGGTGGHIYPALEVARVLRHSGHEVEYYGSFRGQEAQLAARVGMSFSGYDSAPFYGLRSVKGIRSGVKLFRAALEARKGIKIACPQAIFSTGGYAAAPVMLAAKWLKVPLVIHEANSAPGRTNRMFSGYAKSVSSVFCRTKVYIPQTVRTGHPLRPELEEAATSRTADSSQDNPRVLVLGGSQGSAFLNECAIGAGKLMGENIEWTLVAGRANFDQISDKAPHQKFHIKAYLEGEELTKRYREATVILARSGSSLAEFAAFGLPSVLIPLPTAADNHQVINAEEFAEMGAATWIGQSDASPSKIAELVAGWIDSPAARESAQKALHNWYLPHASSTISLLVEEVCK